MSALDFLNKVCNKQRPYISFKQLKTGDYLVENFVLVETKNFGTRARVDLEENYVLLPERFTSVCSNREVLELVAKGRLFMVFGGKDFYCNNR